MFGSSSPDRRLCDAVERNGVYFFRDHRGIETDLLIEHATTRTLVEAKAGQTVTGDALSTIRKVAELLTDAGGTSKAVFIHGGEARQERSGVTVLPWSEVGGVVDWRGSVTGPANRTRTPVQKTLASAVNHGHNRRKGCGDYAIHSRDRGLARVFMGR